ncbi:hypothetical protein JXL21_11655 [Candidatus Bathyarchaeota archaeon]|nr:hypothetical protein [Candidatus Bathyarchaeota archaeon]
MSTTRQTKQQMVQFQKHRIPKVKLSRLQMIKLTMLGCVPTRRRTRAGWAGSIQFYAFRCPLHGIVEDYPHGHGKILRCPLCVEASLIEQ